MEEILFSEEQYWGVITLNRPTAMNALNLSMIQGMREKLIEWENVRDIEGVLIRSNVPQVFCAGGDVLAIYKARGNLSEQLQFFREEYQLNRLIFNYPKPYVSLLDGMTMGGGVGISLHGRYSIGTEGFSFAMPETGIGLFPDIGSSYFLSRLPNSLGFCLALTGQRLGPDLAQKFGLLNYSISRMHLPEFFNQFFSKKAPDLDAFFSDLHAFLKVDDNLSDAFLKKDELGLIGRLFSKPTLSAVFEALAEEGLFQTKIRALLAKKSYMSLALTFLQLKKARSLSFDACLALDEALVSYCLNHDDFYEGVRALLIDKDKTPHWELKTLKVAEKRAHDFFGAIV